MSDQNQPAITSTSDGKNIKVTIDRDLCIGAASCVAVAPKMFALDNEAKAIMLPTANEESFQSALDAAKSCPVAAIHVQDEQGNQLYPA